LELNRSAFIGRCVTHTNSKQFITYPDATTQNLRGINVARPADQLIAYTPQFDSDTNTDATGVEVLVELNQPMLIKPSPAMVNGW